MVGVAPGISGTLRQLRNSHTARRGALATRKSPRKGTRNRTRLAPRNPTHRLPVDDVGAATLRNYNYQSIYGVVLLCGATVGKNDYKAVWCEQEDDLLAEVSSSLFDSYQVKTRTPELGYWDISFKGFQNALNVFLRIEDEFAQAIRYYNFVCDAQPLQSDAKALAHKCPLRLVEAVRTTSSIGDLAKPVQKGLALLAKKTQCTATKLWPILKRLRFPPEPLRKEAAIEVLIATHLPLVPCCTSAKQVKLRRAAVDAINQFDESARLSSLAPERHYACLDPAGKENPQLREKRVSLEAFVQRCQDNVQPGFRYVASTKSVAIQAGDGRRFYVKLEKAGLAAQSETLRARALAAEAVLIDLATRSEGIGDVEHLSALVKAECDDALAQESVKTQSFGPAMYANVITRLDNMAKNEPTKAIGQPREVLIGIAGLLTGECKVWWSKPFNVNGNASG